jgi:hypothetical protein
LHPPSAEDTVQTNVSSIQQQKTTPSTAIRSAENIRRAGRWVDSELSRPGVAAATAGTALVIAAAVAGVAEAAFGAFGALLVYRIAKRRAAKREQ